MAVTRTLGLLLCGLMLSGCGSTPAAPEDHYYRLLVPGTVATSAKPLAQATILVMPLNAEGLLGDRAIAHAQAASPTVLNQYHYHFWSEPPSQLLQHFAADYLRAAAVAGQVLLPELGVDGSHELVGRIRRFEHVRGQPSAVEISLELGLLELQDDRLLLLKTYASRKQVRGPGMGQVTKAFNAGVNEVFARFTADLAALR